MFYQWLCLIQSPFVARIFPLKWIPWNTVWKYIWTENDKYASIIFPVKFLLSFPFCCKQFCLLKVILHWFWLCILGAREIYEERQVPFTPSSFANRSCCVVNHTLIYTFNWVANTSTVIQRRLCTWVDWNMIKGLPVT